MAGEVQGSVSEISNNFFDVFAVTHAEHKEISIEGNVKMLLKLHFEVI